MTREIEDGMGFSGLVPTRAEEDANTYERTRRLVTQAREKRLAELVAENAALRAQVERQRAALTDAVLLLQSFPDERTNTVVRNAFNRRVEAVREALSSEDTP